MKVALEDEGTTVVSDCLQVNSQLLFKSFKLTLKAGIPTSVDLKSRFLSRGALKLFTPNHLVSRVN